MKKLLTLLLMSSQALAASPGSTFIQFSNSGTPTTVSNTAPLPVSAAVSITNPTIGAAVPATANYVAGNKGGLLTGLLIGQQTMANSLACTLPSDQSAIPVTGTFWQATQPVSGTVAATQSGTWTIQPGNTANTTAWLVTGTGGTFPATQSGTWNINNISGTVSLPTGAATAAKQPALGIAGTASSDVITVQGIASMTALKVDGSAVTQPVSAASLPLPTGAATSANQTTANSSLSTIATNTGKTPINTSGSGSAAAATVSTVATLTAPANAVGFILMNLDTSTANIRWAVGRTAATNLGQQLQPGRDTGFVPIGANVSVIAESGTQNIDIQWISQ